MNKDLAILLGGLAFLVIGIWLIHKCDNSRPRRQVVHRITPAGTLQRVIIA